jgi:tetratricopeptide (TPR) repeat protein
MAAAWLEAGRSTGDTTMLQSAFDLSVGPPSESASGLTIIRAHAAHLLGKYDDALAAWRQIVARSDDPGYLNNLAYILLVRGNPADLDEAYKLARTAADAAGSDAGILGTLALAESRKGNRAAAIATYRKAIAIDATNIEAMIGLAEELARGNSNERAEARTLAQRANAKLIGPARQLPELRRQLDAVMAAIDTGSPK